MRSACGGSTGIINPFPAEEHRAALVRKRRTDPHEPPREDLRHEDIRHEDLRHEDLRLFPKPLCIRATVTADDFENAFCIHWR